MASINVTIRDEAYSSGALKFVLSVYIGVNGVFKC